MVGNSNISSILAEFDNIGKDAEIRIPGIFDLLEVFGGHAEAVERANRYLGLVDPPPPEFILSDSSGPYCPLEVYDG